MKLESGFICNDCRMVQFHEKSDQKHLCPKCKKEMENSEAIKVINKERLIYVGIAILLGILFLLCGFLIYKFTGKELQALLITGTIFFLIPFLYLFVVVCGKLFFGFGGLNWLIKKSVLKSPPIWYQKPTLLMALLNEVKLTLTVFIVFISIYFISKSCKG